MSQTETWGLPSLSPLSYSSYPIGGQALPLLLLEPNPLSPSTSHSQLIFPYFSPGSMPQIFLNTHVRSLPLDVFLAYSHPSVWAQCPVCSHCILCISITTLTLCTPTVCLLLYLAPVHHKLLEGGVCVLVWISQLPAVPNTQQLLNVCWVNGGDFAVGPGFSVSGESCQDLCVITSLPTWGLG